MTELLGKIDAYKEKIDLYRPMQEPLLSQLRAYYRIGLTWTSNALEGSSLTESETKVVLEDGLTVAGKPLREYYEAVGHANAYDAMFGLVDRAKPVTEAAIRELHRLFYHQIDEGQAGQYREQRVFITGSRFTPPSAEKLTGAMGGLPGGWRRMKVSSIRWYLRHRHTSGSCSSIPFWTGTGGWRGCS